MPANYLNAHNKSRVIVLVRVFINGYGNIGRRLASSLAADKEIQLVGVAKYSIDDKVKEALENHYDVYVPKEAVGGFKKQGYNVTGSIEEAVEHCDLVVDAAKEGAGYDNKKNLYEPTEQARDISGRGRKEWRTRSSRHDSQLTRQL